MSWPGSSASAADIHRSVILAGTDNRATSHKVKWATEGWDARRRFASGLRAGQGGKIEHPRWALVKNREDLTSGHRTTLGQIVRDNRQLYCGYLIKNSSRSSPRPALSTHPGLRLPQSRRADRHGHSHHWFGLECRLASGRPTNDHCGSSPTGGRAFVVAGSCRPAQNVDGQCGSRLLMSPKTASATAELG